MHYASNAVLRFTPNGAYSTLLPACLPLAACCLLLMTLLSACGTPPKSVTAPATIPARPAQDGAPVNPPDIAALPEPVPRVEPRGKYGNPPSYTVFGQRYTVMENSAGYVERGIASWYGTKFHGQYTSSREPYDMYAFTAAHKTLPIPCYVRVTNLRNGRSLIVRVNDRGPFVDNRLIDLSYAAATRLGILGEGTGLVEVRVIDPAAPEPATALAANDTAAQAATTAPQATRASNLYLQVGAFQSRENAERLQEKLLNKAKVAAQIVTAILNDDTLYRVRVGPMGSVEETDRLSGILHQLGLGTPQVVID